MGCKFIILLGLIGLLWIGLAWAEEKPAPSLRDSKIDPAQIETETRNVKNELGNTYRVEYQKPFIIAGNTDIKLFNRVKNGTLKRCSEALYQDFFDVRPNYPIKVYLFKDAETYQAYCIKTFGEKATTPFGFYMPTDKALIMNIATGTGTLVHEMTHALIYPDFPDVPVWFNEGLASLYEQCQIEENGSLKGLINWRYPRLKKAITKDKLVKLKDLFEMDENTFYGKNSDLHYAETRYFCMYLQENKLLPKFYKAFRHNYYLEENDPKQDRTGLTTLTKLLAKSIEQIEAAWINWTKKLKQE